MSKFISTITRKLDTHLGISDLTDLILEYYKPNNFDDIDYMIIIFDPTIFSQNSDIQCLLKELIRIQEFISPGKIHKLVYISKFSTEKDQRVFYSITSEYLINNIKLTSEEVEKSLYKISWKKILNLEKLVKDSLQEDSKQTYICFKVSGFDSKIKQLLSWTSDFIRRSNLEKMYVLENSSTRVLTMYYK